MHGAMDGLQNAAASDIGDAANERTSRARRARGNSDSLLPYASLVRGARRTLAMGVVVVVVVLAESKPVSRFCGGREPEDSTQTEVVGSFTLSQPSPWMPLGHGRQRGWRRPVQVGKKGTGAVSL